MENKTLGLIVRVLGYGIYVARLNGDKRTEERLSRKLIEIVVAEGREFEYKY